MTVNLVDPSALPLRELDALGYVVAGPFANPRSDEHPTADLLIPEVLRENDLFWSRLCTLTSRVFSLDLGPVRRVFAGELRVHEDAS